MYAPAAFGQLDGCDLAALTVNLEPPCRLSSVVEPCRHGSNGPLMRTRDGLSTSTSSLRITRSGEEVSAMTPYFPTFAARSSPLQQPEHAEYPLALHHAA